MKGTVAIGTFVIVDKEVHWIIDQLNRPFASLHCHVFRPMQESKHGPTVNGLGRGLVELVWCPGFVEIRPENIDDKLCHTRTEINLACSMLTELHCTAANQDWSKLIPLISYIDKQQR